MWFWRSRERFSMAELMYLNDQLQRTTVVTDSNKDYLVETIRSMSELLIWGDQHDPAFFDFFMEKQVMATFVRILRSSSKITTVAVQLLQTLSIMIQNIRSEHAIYYLFSNEYINHLITFPFDFHHEELVAYYIVFLRTISMKLDRNTVSFFIKTNNEEVVSFPLYTEAVKFFHHEEGMVRIAVRTITLSVYNVDDECIRMFVTNPPVVDYFSDLIIFLRKQSFALDRLVAEVSRSPDSGQMQGRLEGAIAEIGDLLYYCNDIINSGVPALRSIMTKHIMNILVLPLLLPSLRPVEISAIAPSDEHISTLTSLYLLLRLLHIVDHKALVNSIGASLLRTDHQAVPLDHRQLHNSECSPDQFGEDGSIVREAIAARPESDDSTAAPSASEALDGRKILLSYLLCNDDKLVMASLCLSVSFLQNEALDESLLDALGILPRRKRHKKLLLQQLIGDKSDKEVDRLFSPSLDRPHDDFMSDHWENHLGDDLLSGSVTLKHRSQMLEALIRLMCRRPPPYAEVLWQAGWLLRQLLPYQEHKISDAHMSLLNDAYIAAQQDFCVELTDCWSDILPAVITEEWKICRKALDTPMLQKDASFVLMPSTQTNTGENLPLNSSIHVGERMRASVKIMMVLYQMRILLVEGTLSEKPPLVELPEEIRVQHPITSTAVGTEVDISDDAMPCRVAFERGKERQVHLLVVLGETTGSLLLIEDISIKKRRGMIRVTAPLVGSDPRVDEKHATWLHLRIRSPHQPLADVGKLGLSKTSPRARHLVDGRWILAFDDPEACKHACLFIQEQLAVQRHAVNLIVSPFLATDAVVHQ
ncbi:hypothetical protein KC19_5G157100 [Ceratodon purpureus]|uniref:FPL domain-containing protein n=1 Tax=Ceratodon purpureus TaxID=3225 RepID=A0A8T0I1Z3_CERPU|nr:hypothetical protein KC19_5G157100 [Ceratodon purpureus]